jgi:hypothetical protein
MGNYCCLIGEDHVLRVWSDDVGDADVRVVDEEGIESYQ